MRNLRSKEYNREILSMGEQVSVQDIEVFHTFTGIRLDKIVDEKSPTTTGSSSDPVGSRTFGKPFHSTPSTVFKSIQLAKA